MKKLLIAGLLALLPSQAQAFNFVARVRVQNVVQRVNVVEKVVVQKQIVQQVNVVERVRFANIIAPTYAVQQLVLPVYQQQFYAPQQQSASCTEQLRILEAQRQNLLLENQNLTLQLRAK